MVQKKVQQKESSEESPLHHDESNSDVDEQQQEQIDTGDQNQSSQQQQQQDYEDEDNQSTPMDVDEGDKEEGGGEGDENRYAKPKQQLHDKAGIVVSVADVKRCFSPSSCPDEAAVFIAASIGAILEDLLSKVEQNAVKDGYLIDSEVIRTYASTYFAEQSHQIYKRYSKVLKSARVPVNRKILVKKSKSKDSTGNATETDKKRPSVRRMFNASSQRLLKVRTTRKKSMKRPSYHSKVNINTVISVCMMNICEAYREVCDRLLIHSNRKHLKTQTCILATLSLLSDDGTQCFVKKRAEKAVERFKIQSTKTDSD